MVSVILLIVYLLNNNGMTNWFGKQGLVQAAVPLTPLTYLQFAQKCHDNIVTTLKIDCKLGHKIRILDSFYSSITNSSNLIESQSLLNLREKRNTLDLSCNEQLMNEYDCKMTTDLKNSNCNGQTTCSIQFFEQFLTDCNSKSNYLKVSYECVPETHIHDVCSNIEQINSWGTLKTTDHPDKLNLNENCWCKLSSNSNQRIVLSVISFQLDTKIDVETTNECLQVGLYLQSDNKRSKDCTHLQKDHYYISSSKNLYLNYYSKYSAVTKNGSTGFWIIYEASDAESKIHLKCGDTDEVRPNDFTRNQITNVIFTPDPFELIQTNFVNLTFSTSTIPTTTTTAKPITTLTTIKPKISEMNTNKKNSTKIVSMKQFISTKSTKSSSTKSPLNATIVSKPKAKEVKSITIKATATTIKDFERTSLSTVQTTLNTTINKPKTTTSHSTHYTFKPITIKIKQKNTTLDLIKTTKEHLSPITSKAQTKPVNTTKTTLTSVSTTTTAVILSLIQIVNRTEQYITAKQSLTTTDLNKSSSNEYVKLSPVTKSTLRSEKNLSKTEFTIIISCILFITLLTFINLIIYVLRKLIKKRYGSKRINDLSSSDPSKKSYDILPGVGEIVLWAANDKRGYLIDINGSWAKIDGQRWLRENMAVLHNTYKKASTAYRKRFKKKEEKKVSKVNREESHLIRSHPGCSSASSSILNQSSCSLQPVPEAMVECETSAHTSSTNTLSDSDFHVKHGHIDSMIFKSNENDNCKQKFYKTNMVDQSSSSSETNTNDDSNYCQVTNDTFKVTSRLEKYFNNHQADQQKELQTNKYDFNSLDTELINEIDFTKIISDSLSIEKQKEFFDGAEKSSPNPTVAPIHQTKKTAQTNRESATVIPTLYFTSCSSSVTYNEPLKLKFGALNSYNSFGKPIAASTENDNKQSTADPTELLHSENYFVRNNDSMSTLQHNNIETSLFLSNIDDFYKLRYETDAKSCLSTSSSMIPILYQNSTSQVDNTFSFKLKQSNEIIKDECFNLESSHSKSINNDLNPPDLSSKQEEQELLSYGNPKELLLIPSNYFQMSNQKVDLHGKLLKEIQNKSMERSQKETCIQLDKHGNLVTNSIDLNKLVSRNSINAPIEYNHECKFEIKSVQLCNIGDGARESRNELNQKDDIDTDESDTLKKCKTFSKIPVKSPLNCSISKVNDSNSTLTSGVGARSMLSEARSKLETFSKMNKNALKNDTNGIKFHFVQTKF